VGEEGVGAEVLPEVQGVFIGGGEGGREERGRGRTRRLTVRSSVRTWSNPLMGARNMIASTFCVYGGGARHHDARKAGTRPTRTHHRQKNGTHVSTSPPKCISLSPPPQKNTQRTTLVRPSIHIHGKTVWYPLGTSTRPHPRRANPSRSPPRGHFHPKSVLRRADRFQARF
jgi:hypothetical protein